MKVYTIDVEAREWFDKVNGNSYFSARIVLNYGRKKQKTFLIPLQYGYGTQYEWTSVQVLKEKGIIKEEESAPLSIICRNKKIILRACKKENCKKQDVTAWGKGE
jgi:hypothetical protein